jgi:hydroxyacylglutathione hydrolase
MLFERVVSEGLAHNSYMVGAGGKAAVIDPRRDCDIYLGIAARNNCTITHIFETHRNEDYVIGSTELADRCGATICHGANLAFSYGKPVREGDRFTFGSLDLTILETPGHTEESISLILIDRESEDKPYAVFCGDTLFAGGIARTDFYGRERNAEMAGKIYDSVVKKILRLGDGVIVCPAHGAGSVCGDEISDRPLTTIGYEKQTNPALLNGREAFVARRINESPYTPPYFRQMERSNIQGAPVLHHTPVFQLLSVDEVNTLRKSGCQIIDIRSPTSFAAGFIPKSLSIWREGLPSFMGWFLRYDQPIVIVDDFNLDPDPVIAHLVRLGYDNLRGWLTGGFSAWSKSALETAFIGTCTVQQLKERLDHEHLFLLDVRDVKDLNRVGHIRGSHHRYIGELPDYLTEIPRDEPIVTYCDGGYKGGLAASILAAHQYRNVTNLLGGMAAWKNAGYRIEK